MTMDDITDTLARFIATTTRGDYPMVSAALDEIVKLRKDIADLRAQIEALKSKPLRQTPRIALQTLNEKDAQLAEAQQDATRRAAAATRRLRDYFAAKALAVVPSMFNEISPNSCPVIALVAYQLADEMLKAREKPIARKCWYSTSILGNCTLQEGHYGLHLFPPKEKTMTNETEEMVELVELVSKIFNLMGKEEMKKVGISNFVIVEGEMSTTGWTEVDIKFIWKNHE